MASLRSREGCEALSCQKLISSGWKYGLRIDIYGIFNLEFNEKNNEIISDWFYAKFIIFYDVDIHVANFGRNVLGDISTDINQTL